MNNINVKNYERCFQQIGLFLKEGPFGLKIHQQEFILCNWKERLQNYAAAAFNALRGISNRHLDLSMQLVKARVQEINHVHQNLTDSSPLFKQRLNVSAITDLWNQQFHKKSSGYFPTAQNWLRHCLGLDWETCDQVSLQIKPMHVIKKDVPLFLEEHFDCYFVNEQQMPLVLSPVNKYMSLTTFHEWAIKNREGLKALTSTHGALLFRDFPVHHADEFASTLKAILGNELLDYLGGEGSRTRVSKGVYTSTEAPSEFHIPLHNELSCTDHPPSYISFYCEIAPTNNSGQTILGNTKRITSAIKSKPEVWNLFRDKKIKYISRHPPTGSFFNQVNKTHKTWQSSFGTNDKKEVERICKKKNFAFKWLKGDWLEITRLASSLKVKEEEEYWFNQAHLYHANPRIRGGRLNHFLANLLYSNPRTQQYSIGFEDGSIIPQKSVYEIYDVLEKETVKFDWKKGDVLIVDNVEALHGRAPYLGQRKILTAMSP